MTEARTAEVARLHNVESVMKRLNLGRSKVFELLSSGQLRSCQVGRRRLVSESALVDFIDKLDDAGEAGVHAGTAELDGDGGAGQCS